MFPSTGTDDEYSHNTSQKMREIFIIAVCENVCGFIRSLQTALRKNVFMETRSLRSSKNSVALDPKAQKERLDD